MADEPSIRSRHGGAFWAARPMRCERNGHGPNWRLAFDPVKAPQGYAEAWEHIRHEFEDRYDIFGIFFGLHAAIGISSNGDALRSLRWEVDYDISSMIRSVEADIRSEIELLRIDLEHLKYLSDRYEKMLRMFLRSFPLAVGIVFTLISLTFLIDAGQIEVDDNGFWGFVFYGLVGIPTIFVGMNVVCEQRKSPKE